MTTPQISATINHRVNKLENINWRELQFIQHEEFKELPNSSRDKLKQSLIKHDFSDPFKVWHDTSQNITYCLDGKHRTLLLEELIKDGIEVPEMLPAVFIECSDIKAAAKLVLVYSSVYAKITEEGLFDFLQSYNFEPEEIKMTINIPELDVLKFESLYGDKSGTDPIIPRSLRERFIVPPFSIFDTRQGYWQDRKKLWSQLFNSQETREDIELIAKSGQAPAIYELRNKMRAAFGRDPEWEEILEEAKQRGMHIYSGASTFDPVLTEICYKWFCPDGGIILDPFAGGSVRGIVAGVLGLKYFGIDLRKEQCIANNKQLDQIDPEKKFTYNVGWEVGDSNIALDSYDKDFDFVFSCPPYHDLEVYSDDPADLSNMSYAEFLGIYRSIIEKSINKLKDNRFACFVVGEIRDENGMYRDFVGDTVQAFKDHGMEFYNEIILINVSGSLPVRIGRQFEGYRKVGKMHQNVLVFYKGDPKKIKEEFPEIKVEEYLQELNYQPNIALTTTG